MQNKIILSSRFEVVRLEFYCVYQVCILINSHKRITTLTHTHTNTPPTHTHPAHTHTHTPQTQLIDIETIYYICMCKIL